MEDLVQELKRWLDRYFAGEATREALAKWAGEVYLDLLRGGFLWTERLMVYPFVRELCTIDKPADDMADFYPCTQERARGIWDTLCGRREDSICITVQLPEKGITAMVKKDPLGAQERECLLKARDGIAKALQEGLLAPEGEAAGHVAHMAALRLPETTLFGLLLHRAKTLAHALYQIDLEAGTCEPKEYSNMALYTKRNSAGERQLLRTLDCCLGLQPFAVLLSFGSTPQLTLLL